MIRLDPLSLPVVTIVRPFKVLGLKGTTKEKLNLLKFCKKDFQLKKELMSTIKTNELVQLEMRCIRLDGRGKVGRSEPGFALGKSEYQEPCMQLPNKGFYSFNLLNSTEFALPKREDIITE